MDTMLFWVAKMLSWVAKMQPLATNAKSRATTEMMGHAPLNSSSRIVGPMVTTYNMPCMHGMINA